MKVWVWVSLALLCACGGAGKEGPKDAPKGPPAGRRGPIAFPVELLEVQPERVEYSIHAVGSLEAFEQVQITARIAGAIDKLDFAEGDLVKAGQALVEIEPRRFQLALEQARATLARVEAEKAESDSALARRLEANEKSPGLVRAEEIETLRARAAAATAKVAEAKSALGLAELNLNDAFVRAPMAGRIESRDVRTGQYVQPGAKVATLLRRDPLLLRFPVSELDARKLSHGQKLRFTVRGASYGAIVTHVAQAADAATRQVAIVARVDDPRAKELTPGTFAEIEVPLETRDASTVVPETAVRPSERGFLAFVVEGEQAKERVLTLGLRTPDGRVEVLSGLTPGDKLVVRGGEALSEGAKVKIPGAK